MSKKITQFHQSLTGIRIFKSNKTGTLAYGSVEVGNFLTVEFQLANSPKTGKPYLRLPSYKKDDGTWHNQVDFVRTEEGETPFRFQMLDYVLDAYNTQVKNASSAPPATVAEDEAPF